MANLSAVIVPAKILSNGKHKIRISVSHNGGVRYVVTDIILNSENEFRNGQIVKRPDAAYLNTKLRKLIQECQEEIDSIDYIDGLTVAELISLRQDVSKHSRRSLRSAFDEYVKIAVQADGSKTAYRHRFTRISSFIPPKTIMESITRSTVLGFAMWLRDKKYSPTTQRITLTFLKTLVNYAVKSGYVEYRVNPFNGIPMPEGLVRNAWLSPEEIVKIRDVELRTQSERRARDLFMLSYYLGGMNVADILRLNFGEMNGFMSYKRKKTENTAKSSASTEFEICREAQEIIDRNIDEGGFFAASEFERQKCCGDLIWKGMRAISYATGIKKVIFYSARKSFAQHAFALGVDTSTIDYILGHSMKPTKNILYHYITVTPTMATQAMRKVFDNLK